MRFEWDPRKAEVNLRKHGVRFGEALTIFDDPMELVIADPAHSDVESRFLSLGRSSEARLLVVAYTERGDALRIISARPASPKERKMYDSSKIL